jgi:hypothetical protein
MDERASMFVEPWKMERNSIPKFKILFGVLLNHNDFSDLYGNIL